MATNNMNFTHLTLNGEQITVNEAESILPDQNTSMFSQSQRIDDFSDDSDIFSCESPIEFERKELVTGLKIENIENLSVVQSSRKMGNELAGTQKQKNKVMMSLAPQTLYQKQFDFQKILDMHKTKLSQGMKLTSEVVIEHIESEDGENQKMIEENKKKRKKKFRENKFQKKFEEDEVETDRQKKYFMKAIQKLEKEKEQLQCEREQQSKVIAMLLQSGASTPRPQHDPPKKEINREKPPSITGQNLEISMSEDDREILSNEGNNSEGSIQTQIKNRKNILMIEPQPQILSSYQQSHTVEKYPQEKQFIIPEIEIDQYPLNKTAQELYYIGRNLFQKFGLVESSHSFKIKIVNHPNSYLFSMNESNNIIWKKNGEFYLGGWRNHSKNGLGFDLKPLKYKYKGYYVNGKKEGKGHLKTIDGKRYFGDWLNGKKQGFGKQIDSDGNYYIGEWKNNQYHGKGTYFSVSAGIYFGDFKDGMKHGHIVWYSKESGGDKFEGMYKNDQKNGYGQYFWENGKQYKGVFSSGFRIEGSAEKISSQNLIGALKSKSLIGEIKIKKELPETGIRKINKLVSLKKQRQFNVRNISSLPKYNTIEQELNSRQTVSPETEIKLNPVIHPKKLYINNRRNRDQQSPEPFHVRKLSGRKATLDIRSRLPSFNKKN